MIIIFRQNIVWSLLVLLLLSGSLSAQIRTEWSGNPDAWTLLDSYRKINAMRESIPGFRIQIHSDSDRDKIRETKARFLTANPGWSAYESYQSPNFRIRVGDFRSRLEAAAALSSLQAEFPSAFVVEDEIHLPSLEP